eukprot:TRINITY_DN21392_c0_g1_i1.p1 TRINITY_DN21392_c0_g1~~TRINITY_DN21392_c0_g1_i1.p1  ORF type:complete len:498 (+),score=54.81 TRINITY_DN21392_c0_g1_i1:129-1622(+)
MITDFYEFFVRLGSFVVRIHMTFALRRLGFARSFGFIRTSGAGYGAKCLNFSTRSSSDKKGRTSKTARLLTSIDDRFHIFKAGQTVLDLGCCPGGWSQVAVSKTTPLSDASNARQCVLGVDIVRMEPIRQHTFVQGDFTSSLVQSRLLKKLGMKGVDVILSDCGVEHGHDTSTELCRQTMSFAAKALTESGKVVVRLVRGPKEDRLLADLEEAFESVKQVRLMESQVCFVCFGYRGPRVVKPSSALDVDEEMQVRARRTKKSDEIYMLAGNTTKIVKLPSLSVKQRHVEDEYVQLAKKHGYRCRSAFKLQQIDDTFGFFRENQTVVDLGCAPGGWSQVALSRIGGGRVVGIDRLSMDPLPNHTFVLGDFSSQAIRSEVESLIGAAGADVVLSDMAPRTRTVGRDEADHEASVLLCGIAQELALEILKPEGWFVFKLFRGSGEREVTTALEARFRKVVQVQPPATRSASREVYIVCAGFQKLQGNLDGCAAPHSVAML